MAPNLHEFLLRLKALFLKRRMDRDMAEELAFHRAMLREKLLREGVPQSEVNAATQRTFGDTSRWHERLRELWQFRSLENLARDVAFSARVLRKSPDFTVVAIVTLALGAGANTCVFSVVNGLLLRPLPVPASDRLAVLGISQGNPLPDYTFPEPLFRSLERHHESFSEVFAFSPTSFQVKGQAGSENISGQFVSGDVFPALQTAPLLGRTLGPQDDQKGGNPAGFGVVIGESFWQRWFNRASDVVGKKLEIDNTIFTIVGVMPKRFIGADPLERPDLFVPMSAEPTMNGSRSMTAGGIHDSWLNVIGRLKPQVTLEQANAAAGAASGTVLRDATSYARWIADREKHRFRFIAEPGSTGFT